MSSGAAFLHTTAANGAATAQEPHRRLTPLGLDEFYRPSNANPLTPEKVALGRQLFFDPLLSADRSIACASCHQPARAFGDSVAFSPGVFGRAAARHTPSILNRAYGTAFFWDGRAGSLEETVLQPIQNPLEMDLTLGQLLARLRRDVRYREQFSAIFDDGITERNLAHALASYVRSLRSGNSPFDRFVMGDRAAFSAEAEAGYRLFGGKANCAACHDGANFTDEQFHNTGVAFGDDLGRFAVTAWDEDLGAFKTPSLRNVALTVPYMHDGSIATLEAVVDLYDRGGGQNPHLDPEIRPLNLTAEEKRNLIAFLRSLTGDVRGRE